MAWKQALDVVLDLWLPAQVEASIGCCPRLMASCSGSSALKPTWLLEVGSGKCREAMQETTPAT